MSAADDMGIPTEPPPGFVASPPYHPPAARGTTLEDRVATLEYLVEDLKRQLASARASTPMHSPGPYSYFSRDY